MSPVAINRAAGVVGVSTALINLGNVPGEFHRAIRAAVETRGDRIGFLAAGANLCREGFGIVLRRIAEQARALVEQAPVAIGRDAVDDQEMILGSLDAAADELDRVARADPGRELPLVLRLHLERADAQARDAHAVLVG